MSLPDALPRRGRGRGRLPHGGLAWLLLWGVVGCRTPPAGVSPAGEGPGLPRPGWVLARQLAVDSAAEVAHRPLRAGRELATEPAEHLWAAAEGMFGKRLQMRLLGPAPPLSCCRPSCDPAELEADLQTLTRTPLQPAQLALFTDGGEALAALKGLIDQAGCRLDVCMFQWENDGIGAAVAEWLAERAACGVRVRVLVDGAGNLIFGHPEPDGKGDVNAVVAGLARRPGVELVRTRDPFGRFDHRKLVIADGRYAWTGGRNFDRPSFVDQHDLSFTLCGPLVAELEKDFEDFWRDQGGCPAPRAEPEPSAEGNAYARVVGTGPCRRHLAGVLYRAMDHACNHIYLENFCVCDSRLLLKLAQARRRGVDVRVVLTVCCDTPQANCVNRLTTNRLLRAGVRVYAYPGMSHTKAATVDGSWAYLGTANFDPLSLRRNRELGLSVGAGPLPAEVEQTVLCPDFRPEWEVKKPLPVSAKDVAWELMVSLFL